MQLAAWAKELQGMESYCIKEFAEALEVIPYTLAENAGLNPISIVTELRNRHARGEKNAGINVRKGQITNILEENVVQPLLVSTSAITLACDDPHRTPSSSASMGKFCNIATDLLGQATEEKFPPQHRAYVPCNIRLGASTTHETVAATSWIHTCRFGGDDDGEERADDQVCADVPGPSDGKVREEGFCLDEVEDANTATVRWGSLALAARRSPGSDVWALAAPVYGNAPTRASDASDPHRTPSSSASMGKFCNIAADLLGQATEGKFPPQHRAYVPCNIRFHNITRPLPQHHETVAATSWIHTCRFGGDDDGEERADDQVCADVPGPSDGKVREEGFCLDEVEDANTATVRWGSLALAAPAGSDVRALAAPYHLLANSPCSEDPVIHVDTSSFAQLPPQLSQGKLSCSSSLPPPHSPLPLLSLFPLSSWEETPRFLHSGPCYETMAESVTPIHLRPPSHRRVWPVFGYFYPADGGTGME
nr:unnamed protein product [Digitaria exilis]